MEMSQENRDARRYYNPLQKDYITFLETSEESGGERTLIEVDVAPGRGTSLHYHLTDDERFEVLEGTLELQIGNAPVFLRPGNTATARRTVAHNFRNPMNEPIRFLAELRPGNSGFEKMLKVGYGLSRDLKNGGPPRNLYHLALMSDWGYVYPARGPLSFRPLVQFLVKRARRKGIDRELEEKYYR